MVPQCNRVSGFVIATIEVVLAGRTSVEPFWSPAAAQYFLKQFCLWYGFNIVCDCDCEGAAV